ncbi:MAG: ATP-dependent helicase, partial [Candidatus Pacebacteria bacterium]|nr:ATP-dependent helicase [Candidatus Paceibacterota bacterium]
MQIFNKKINKVGDDLKKVLKPGSKIDIAAAIFSIYGFESLKKELKQVKQLRFIFTDPTFIKAEKESRQKRKFAVSPLDSSQKRKAIAGSELEIKLKNKLNGQQIARECRRWVEEKVKFKSNKSTRDIQEQLIVKDSKVKDSEAGASKQSFLYNGIKEFSSAGLGYEKDNAIIRNIIKTDDYE